MVSQEKINKLTYRILGCAIEIHRSLGPGLLESVYKACFLTELQHAGLNFKNELRVPVIWRDKVLDTDYRMDVLVEDLVVVELKSAEGLLPVHEAQLLTYMRLTQKPKGLLINFNCVNIFKEGQKTMVNQYFAALPKH